MVESTNEFQVVTRSWNAENGKLIPNRGKIIIYRKCYCGRPTYGAAFSKSTVPVSFDGWRLEESSGAFRRSVRTKRKKFEILSPFQWYYNNYIQNVIGSNAGKGVLM